MKSYEKNIRVRYSAGETYYIASEEVEWDYAPSGQDRTFSSRKPRYTVLSIGRSSFSEQIKPI